MEIKEGLRLSGFAFYLDDGSQAEGHRILANIAKRHGVNTTSHIVGDYRLTLVSHIHDLNDSTTGLRHGTITICSDRTSGTGDRRAVLRISDNCLDISVDHYGSVPVFFREHGPLAVSNIITAVGHTDQLLSRAGLYTLLRLGHPLWNDTPWLGIAQLTPGSTLSVDTSTGSIQVVVSDVSQAGMGRKSFNPAVSKSVNLRDLNIELVRESLKEEEQIVLPLSSGYDSRMILAALSDSPSLRDRTVAFTYGPPRGIEVTSAKHLAELAGVRWHYIDLDTTFLTPLHLVETAEIFGASLHMHAMYQINFWREVRQILGENLYGSVITSGFMTGVPAGQHVSKMRSKNGKGLHGLQAFTQSQWWTPEELRSLGFDNDDERALHDSVTSIRQQYAEGARGSVWLDCLTRQRAFISYYPRYFEWKLPVHSPHNSRRYIDYFQQIPIAELQNRKHVETMFREHYPELSRVPSDSNLLRGLGSRAKGGSWAARMLLARMFKGLKHLSLFDTEVSFDGPALASKQNMALWGLDAGVLRTLWPTDVHDSTFYRILETLVEGVGEGNLSSYYKLTSLQSINLESSVRQTLVRHI